MKKNYILAQLEKKTMGKNELNKNLIFIHNPPVHARRRALRPFLPYPGHGLHIRLPHAHLPHAEDVRPSLLHG